MTGATRTIAVPTPEAMEELGRRLGARLRAGDLVVLVGELGAGKTTLTRGIGEGMGVRGAVASPTFVLARVHPSLTGGAPLVHVDAYRLGSAAELDDLDLDFEASATVVEWGEGLLDGVAESWLTIRIERPVGGDIGENGESEDSGSGSGTSTSRESLETLDDPEALVAERTVTLEPHGPRWDDQAIQEVIG